MDKFLGGLPSNGLLSQSLVQSPQKPLDPPKYLATHSTSPSSGAMITTDTTNLLVRSLKARGSPHHPITPRRHAKSTRPVATPPSISKRSSGTPKTPGRGREAYARATAHAVTNRTPDFRLPPPSSTTTSTTTATATAAAAATHSSLSSGSVAMILSSPRASLNITTTSTSTSANPSSPSSSSLPSSSSSTTTTDTTATTNVGSKRSRNSASDESSQLWWKRPRTNSTVDSVPPRYSSQQLWSKTTVELKTLAKEYKASVSGKKSDLVQRILSHQESRLASAGACLAATGTGSQQQQPRLGSHTEIPDSS